MKRLSLLLFILVLLPGCWFTRTMDGEGSYAGAGTYDLDDSIDGAETVLVTQPSDEKLLGFEVLRIPLSDLPVSELTALALGLALEAGDINDVPTNEETEAPISSNWAYEHENSEDGHPVYAMADEIPIAVAVDASGFKGNLRKDTTTIQQLAELFDALKPGLEMLVQADDPTIASDTGYYIASTSEDFFYVRHGIGAYNISAGTLDDADTTGPVITDNGTSTLYDAETDITFSFSVTDDYLSECAYSSEALGITDAVVTLVDDAYYSETFSPLETEDDVDFTVSCVDIAGNSTDYSFSVRFGSGLPNFLYVNFEGTTEDEQYLNQVDSTEPVLTQTGLLTQKHPDGISDNYSYFTDAITNLRYDVSGVVVTDLLFSMDVYFERYISSDYVAAFFYSASYGIWFYQHADGLRAYFAGGGANYVDSGLTTELVGRWVNLKSIIIDKIGYFYIDDVLIGTATLNYATYSFYRLIVGASASNSYPAEVFVDNIIIDTYSTHIDITKPRIRDNGSDTSHDTSTDIAIELEITELNTATCTYSSTALGLTDVAMTLDGESPTYTYSGTLQPAGTEGDIDLSVSCSDDNGNTGTYSTIVRQPNEYGVSSYLYLDFEGDDEEEQFLDKANLQSPSTINGAVSTNYTAGDDSIYSFLTTTTATNLVYELPDEFNSNYFSLKFDLYAPGSENMKNYIMFYTDDENLFRFGTTSKYLMFFMESDDSLISQSIPKVFGTWRNIKITVSFGTLKIYINDTYYTAKSFDFMAKGLRTFIINGALGAYYSPGTIYLDNLEVDVYKDFIPPVLSNNKSDYKHSGTGDFHVQISGTDETDVANCTYSSDELGVSDVAMDISLSGSTYIISSDISPGGYTDDINITIACSDSLGYTREYSTSVLYSAIDYPSTVYLDFEGDTDDERVLNKASDSAPSYSNLYSFSDTYTADDSYYSYYISGSLDYRLTYGTQRGITAGDTVFSMDVFLESFLVNDYFGHLYYSSNGAYAIYMHTVTTGIRCTFNRASSYYVTATYDEDWLNRWVNLKAIQNGTLCSFYVDNVLIGTVSHSSSASLYDYSILSVGGSSSGGYPPVAYLDNIIVDSYSNELDISPPRIRNNSGTTHNGTDDMSIELSIMEWNSLSCTYSSTALGLTEVAMTLDGESLVYTYSSTLSPDSLTDDIDLTFTCTDNSGNVGTKTLTYIYDGTAPIITDNGTSTTHNGTDDLTLSIGITELYLSACTYSSTALSLTDVATTLSGSAPDYTYSTAISPNSLTDDIDLTFTCTDDVGNVGTETYTCIYDGTAPIVTDNGSSTTHNGTDDLTLSVSITELYQPTCTYSSTALSLSDVAMTLSGSAPDYTYSGTISPNSVTDDIDFTVTCTDEAGNTGTYSTTLTYTSE